LLAALFCALPAFSQSGNAIPPSFLAISAIQQNYPLPMIGALSHQEFLWGQIEQAPSVYDFSWFDQYVGAAQQHGLVDATNTASVAITLSGGTPSWAVADQSTCGANGICTAPPDRMQDWKDFLNVVMQHFNGQDHPHIRYFELWNEANNPVDWTGTNAQMLALAQAAYPIVHQDRYSQLLTPSVAGPAGTVSPTSQINWMTAYLKAGGSNYADGGAFHAYPAGASAVAPFPMPEQDATAGCTAFVTCNGSIVTIATQLRAVFDNYGLAGKPMLETEGSWGNASINDPATQTAWLARYILLQAGMRASLNLQMASWFAWAPPSFGWGTIATSALQPNTAGLAYTQLYNWLVGATITKPCAGIANGTWTCSFTRPGGYVAIAAWNTQGYINYTPGLSYTRYRDLAGNTTQIGADNFVDIGPEPILIEGTAAGTGLTPVVSLVANAEGEIPVIAPNTWVEVKGFNLARAGDSRIWQDSDFVNDRLPAQLDGVSVTVNGKPAYVYYISPTQIDILTPPDALSGQVPVQVTYNNYTTPAVTVLALAAAPSFFVYGGGPYVAAEHANGKYLGPANLYPGLSTPAKPGETILIYANGFGATSQPVQSGSLTQAGVLAAMPSVEIGELPAQVLYAGLVGVGEFQFNVVVPASLASGDQTIVATYNGVSTQPGLLLTVQQ
jgi:uncharacterized protein (TIGR03437 family)